MASLLPAASATAAAAASASKTTTSSSCLPFDQRYCCHSKVSFHLSPLPKFRFSTKGQRSYGNHYSVVKAQSNEVRSRPWFSLQDMVSVLRSFWDFPLAPSVAFKVAVDGSSNAAATPATKSEVPASEEKNAEPVKEPSHAALATEESLSEFIKQVSSLVKLVDSKDIMELQMKQLDCEIIIRKKEALPQPPYPASMVMMHPSSPPPTAAPTPSAPAPSTSAPAPSPPAAKSPKSSLPPLKCPMAGTLYRSPAPGEPPFVKVGDKVQKGQVVCIIEAMKLMNEIEADQSGTIVEVLVEEGKPVSVDTPLFVIQP